MGVMCASLSRFILWDIVFSITALSTLYHFMRYLQCYSFLVTAIRRKCIATTRQCTFASPDRQIQNQCFLSFISGIGIYDIRLLLSWLGICVQVADQPGSWVICFMGSIKQKVRICNPRKFLLLTRTQEGLTILIRKLNIAKDF